MAPNRLPSSGWTGRLRRSLLGPGTVAGDGDPRALDGRASADPVPRGSAENRFRHLVQNASDMIFVIGPDSTISYTSPSVTRILGYQAAELVGTKLIALVDPDERGRVMASYARVLERPGVSPERIECRWRHRDGSYLYVENSRTNLLHEPDVGGVILNSRDITERKALEGQLTRQAFHDPLTGLANRALFRDRVEHALASRGRPASSPAVLFLDLDDFKTVNDSLGHLAGDRLLLEASKRLLACLRPEDTAARLGGDEFGVLLADHGEGAVPAEVAGRVADVLAEPFVLDGHRVAMSASVGIVEGGSPGQSADDILRDADLAMYEAKYRGKARHEVFAPQMHSAALRRLELAEDIHRSVDEAELDLRYQPVVCLSDRSIVGFEALVRWNHPRHGVLAPFEWIAAAEASGVIVSMGRWVLGEACGQLARWRLDRPGLGVAVHVSPRQLADDPGLVEEVVRTLEANGLPAEALTLELTENLAIVEGSVAESRLAALAAVGVRIALDDFGTGYASFDCLRRFPVGMLKIAPTFTDPLCPASGTAGLLNGILEFARALGVEAVAEGIETPEHLEELLALGAELGQGHLFAPPLTPCEAAELLAGGLAPACEPGPRGPVGSPRPALL